MQLMLAWPPEKEVLESLDSSSLFAQVSHSPQSGSKTAIVLQGFTFSEDKIPKDDEGHFLMLWYESQSFNVKHLMLSYCFSRSLQELPAPISLVLVGHMTILKMILGQMCVPQLASRVLPGTENNVSFSCPLRPGTSGRTRMVKMQPNVPFYVESLAGSSSAFFPRLCAV